MSGPARVPSVAMSVLVIAATPVPSKLLAVSGLHGAGFGPSAGSHKPILGVDSDQLARVTAGELLDGSGFSMATVPRMPRSRPHCNSSSARSVLRTPPNCTGMEAEVMP